jgi:ribonucleoside-diphosphate reductase beta chain
MGAGRVRVDDKKIINCHADLNQLVPFKYEWAWQKYLDACANHWMPQEINMNADIALWKDPNGLTDDERTIIKRNLGFFSTADSLVANNLVLAVYRHITNPECRQYLLRQAFEEALHTHAYQYVVESLGLDEGEIFNMYREVPSVARKAEWALPYTQYLADPHFHTGTPENDQQAAARAGRLLRHLRGHLLLRRLRAGPQHGPAQQDDRHRRAVPVHPARRVHAHELRHRRDQPDQDREPAPLDRRVQARADRHDPRRRDLEAQYAHDTMPRGVLGLNAPMFEEYLHFIANRRCAQIGLPEQYPGDQPLPLDVRGAGSEEGEELLRDAGHRVSDGRGAELGLMSAG